MTDQPIDPRATFLRGLTTVVFMVDDFDGAKSWYADILGIVPYMDTPAYAEFRLGEYLHEFGLLNTAYAAEMGSAPTAPGGAIVYWHVDDTQAAIDRLIAKGATLHHPPRDFGRGFIGASVIDPFGHILAVMYNPHYIDMRPAHAA